MSQKSGVSDQVLSLPKGGGAIDGLGEKFSVDLQTGTGSITIPIELPAGRAGLQPSLSLRYNGGHGNGECGFGWALGISGIHRRTSHGIPRYDDAHDVFTYGSDDLVPVARDAPGVTRYRPRIEGLFARITHHRDATTDHWEVRTKDGLVNCYGTPGAGNGASGVVAKPGHPHHIFEWLLTSTTDPFGNRIEYVYERDDDRIDGPHEWDRSYLTEIRYADNGAQANPSYLIRIRLSYEPRPDPFSEYRAGFEIRTVRRCTRIDLVTDPGPETLVRRVYLVYADQRTETVPPANGVSLLSLIRVAGIDGAQSQSMPPVEIGYTRFDPDSRDLMPVGGPELPPSSLADPEFEHADLFACGLPDIVQINESGTRFWRNLGGGRYDRPRLMKEAPTNLTLASPSVQLLDADGDGRIDLMVNSDELAGFFPLRSYGLWDRRSFRRYAHAPTFDLEDPQVRLIDLNGDGVVDALRSGGRLECFFNDAAQGWRKVRTVERHPAESFPDVDFADPRVKLGDMTGDGLQDIVIVHDGSVDYWPALGWGDWGRRVSMKNSPRLPWGWDPKRLLLGDVDGDGAADLVYVEDGKVTLWINQSGNGFADPIVIHGTPPVSDMDAVRLVDLLGSGVGGIFWTRDFDGSQRDRFFFLDFTGGTKPYLANRVDNHMGAVTHVEYAPSTRFFLEDEQSVETRWRTSLPFPVQVVRRVDVIDQISGGKLTTEYRYRHGYWDGIEHEFRGFARVDQRDSESFQRHVAPGGDEDSTFTSVDRKFFSPPTEIRAWFHVGPVGDGGTDWAELDLSSEYWSEDPPAPRRPAAVAGLLGALPRSARREALRGFRSMTLRTELYGLDGGLLMGRPYTVGETAHELFEVVEDHGKPKLLDRPISQGTETRIFYPCPSAARETQWERGSDPLTRLTFTHYRDQLGEPDRYGRPRSSVEVGVPRGRDYRRAPPGPRPPFLATQVVTEYAERDDASRYITARPARTTSYELIDDDPTGSDVFRFATTIGRRRVIGQSETRYDGPAFIGLPIGSLGNFGAPVRSDELVLSDTLVTAAYGPSPPPYLAGAPAGPEYPAAFISTLVARAGYVVRPIANDPDNQSGYYVTTEQRRYDFQTGAVPAARGLVLERRDALGNATTLDYDSFDLLVERVTNSLGFFVTADYDYRLLQPIRITDENGNVSGARYTPLGLPESIAVLGKAGDKGDTVAQPSVRYEYQLEDFATTGAPLSIRTIRRVYHARDDDPDIDPHRIDDAVETVEYADGFNRVLQTRTLAEDALMWTDEGDRIVPQGSAALPSAQGLNASAIATVRPAGSASPHVTVSGWQTYDNKGRAVERFESYFSQSGWAFEPPAHSELGQRVELYYDPRGQLIRVVQPDGSERRVLHGVPTALNDLDRITPTPWEAYSYDENDNAARTPLAPAAPAEHHDTPSSIEIDALGRIVRSIQRSSSFANGAWTVQSLVTVSTYDIRGNLVEVTDPGGRVAFRRVYALGIEPNALRTVTHDAGLRTSVYGAAGNLIEQRSGRGAATFRVSDALGRPVRQWARDAASEAVTLRDLRRYDDDGLPGPETRNLRGRLHLHYDEAGRVTYPSYDFKGNVLAKHRRVIGDATLLKAFSPTPPQWQVQVFRADWDPLDEGLLDARDYHTGYTYDALGRITRLETPRGTSARTGIRFTYDRAGLPIRLTRDGEVFVEHIAHDASGRRLMVAYGNGIMTRYAYHPLNRRLVRIRSEPFQQPTSTTYAPKGTPLQDFAYDHDTVGNVNGISERVPACGLPAHPDTLDRVFTYDALYRLLSATGRQTDFPPDPPWDPTPRSTDPNAAVGYTEQYGYDDLGNLTRVSHSAGATTFVRQLDQLVASTNRLTKVTLGATNHPFTYDDDGNVTAEALSRHYEWDYAGRLRAFRNQLGNSEPTDHVQYLYDSDGQRVKKLRRKSAGPVEVSVYVEGVFEHHQVGGQEAFHVSLLDGHERIAVVRDGPPLPGDDIPSSVPAIYRLTDQLGGSHVVLDAAGGAFVRREEYTPFGETSFGSFGRARYRFTGKERDQESGLYYHGARYYSSWLGRWMSPDPMGISDGLNLYRYVSNNPVRAIDPNGSEGLVMSGPGSTVPLTGTPPAPTGVPSDGAPVRGLWRFAISQAPNLVRGWTLGSTTAAVGIAVVALAATGFVLWTLGKASRAQQGFGIHKLEPGQAKSLAERAAAAEADRQRIRAADQRERDRRSAPGAAGQGPVKAPAGSGPGKLEAPASQPATAVKAPGERSAVPVTLPGAEPATPLELGDVDVARKAALSSTFANQRYACVEFSEELVRELEAAGIHGEVLRLHPGRAKFIYSDSLKKSLSYPPDPFHIAVRVGDTTFDNMHPGGLPHDAYVKDIGGEEFFRMGGTIKPNRRF